MYLKKVNTTDSFMCKNTKVNNLAIFIYKLTCVSVMITDIWNNDFKQKWSKLTYKFFSIQQ